MNITLKSLDATDAGVSNLSLCSDYQTPEEGMSLCQLTEAMKTLNHSFTALL